MADIQYRTIRDSRRRPTGTILACLGQAQGEGRDKASAKEKLLAEIDRAVTETGCRAMWCATGEVLVVRYAYGCWTYSIARKDCGPFASSCHSSADYVTTLEQARSHAAQSYGGVVCEQSL